MNFTYKAAVFLLLSTINLKPSQKANSDKVDIATRVQTVKTLASYYQRIKGKNIYDLLPNSEKFSFNNLVKLSGARSQFMHEHNNTSPNEKESFKLAFQALKNIGFFSKNSYEEDLPDCETAQELHEENALIQRVKKTLMTERKQQQLNANRNAQLAAKLQAGLEQQKRMLQSIADKEKNKSKKIMAKK